jgi:hypothetical protein
MFKLLSALLLSFAMTSANCVPVVQKEIIITNQKEVMICDQQKITEGDLIVFQNQVSNSTNQTCQDCEILVHLIQHQMTVANKTLADIIIAVKDVCQQLHSPSGKECLIIIDEIKQIIDWIMNGLSFKQICQKLGFCSIQKERQYFIRNSSVNY